MRVLFFLASFFLFACSGDEDNYDGPCNDQIIVDEGRYNSTQTDNYSIINAEIVEDCLEIIIVASGCSGDSWTIEMFDSGNIAESFPIQRFVRVKIDNTEACLAVVQRTRSFDLNPIRTEENIIRLNLDGWQDQLEYEY